MECFRSFIERAFLNYFPRGNKLYAQELKKPLENFQRFLLHFYEEKNGMIFQSISFLRTLLPLLFFQFLQENPLHAPRTLSK